jgi:hypothetical protein
MKCNPRLNSIRDIHCQDVRSGASGSGQSDNRRAIENEVLMPQLKTWIEQAYDISGLRIDPGEVGALVPIAEVARKSKILGVIAAAMLSSDNVFDMKW